MAFFDSLTGGGGLSSSESGDAVSGAGGVHQTFGGTGGSPLRPRGLIEQATPVLVVLAGLAIAWLLLRR